MKWQKKQQKKQWIDDDRRCQAARWGQLLRYIRPRSFPYQVYFCTASTTAYACSKSIRPWMQQGRKTMESFAKQWFWKEKFLEDSKSEAHISDLRGRNAQAVDDEVVFYVLCMNFYGRVQRKTAATLGWWKRWRPNKGWCRRVEIEPTTNTWPVIDPKNRNFHGLHDLVRVDILMWKFRDFPATKSEHRTAQGFTDLRQRAIRIQRRLSRISWTSSSRMMTAGSYWKSSRKEEGEEEREEGDEKKERGEEALTPLSRDWFAVKPVLTEILTKVFHLSGRAFRKFKSLFSMNRSR